LIRSTERSGVISTAVPAKNGLVGDIEHLAGDSLFRNRNAQVLAKGGDRAARDSC